MEIKDGVIQTVTPCVPIDWKFRLDVLPFIIGYSVFFSLAACKETMTLSLYLIPALLLVHSLLFLVSQWSLTLKQILGYKVVKDISDATFVFVIAAKNMGKNRVEQLNHRSRRHTSNLVIAGTSFEHHALYFEFQNILYGYSSKNKCFCRELYPVKGSIEDFISCKGHKNLDSLTDSIEKWGENIFEIPIPLFLDLYVGHITAPFFVFQILCLGLWSLDDYWYYSAFTLLMLMLFEGMLCRQRQASLLMLRNMRRPPILLFAYRCRSWQKVSSESLVPGDIISLVAYSKVTQSRRNTQPNNTQEDLVLPCDALLIRGSCVVNEAMLTGESVPQMKETVRNSDNYRSNSNSSQGIINLSFEDNDDTSWRRHVVMGGTSLLQHSPNLSDGDGEAPNRQENPEIDPVDETVETPPDLGCTAVVIRTGFATVQGGLMRKILFATERVNVNEYETAYFIGVLVVFALIAAGVVLSYGIHDTNRNQFKLVLHCIMIITSVVPPELPMELSLAITSSLTSLAKCLVYCTEPFRLPYAGKLDILCFDKTGTLTQDKMYLKGVIPSFSVHPIDLLQEVSTSSTELTCAGGHGSDSTMAVDPISVRLAPTLMAVAMASCHSLVLRSPDNILSYIGDPLEMASLEATGYNFEASKDCRAALLPFIVSPDRKIHISLKHRFPFNSTLKRMSVIVDVALTANTSSPVASYVFTKGAPEVIAALIKTLPVDYKRVYLHHMSKGKRVLALCYRSLSIGQANSKGIQSRESMEMGLTFMGFLIFDCDLKPDSRSVIKELNESKHKLIMITGDSPYTASDVALRLGMVPKDVPILILQSTGGLGSKLFWKKSSNFDEGESEDDITFDAVNTTSSIAKLTQSYSLCITGPALVALQGQIIDSILAFIATNVRIFARVSPSQKEGIIRILNSSGAYTLMCGDGTNDVGALKAAHVGVSIVNDPSFENKIDASHGGGKKGKGSGAKDRVARAMAELQEQEIDPTIVKLGDASIASPFTSRRTSIDAVMTVLRQGRATLVTTVEVYKILALNCLVSAYMMSALYLQGLKNGDMQMTVSGLISAGLFFFLSQAKPLQKISPQRPSSSVFSSAVILSIGGQFLVHFASLLTTISICKEHAKPGLNDFGTVDGKFQPDITNSAIYVLCTMIQVNSFIVNYRGHPFTESVQDNKLLWRSVQGLYLALLVVVGGQLEPLNDFLQLAPWPSSQFQVHLVLILAFNLGAIFCIEKACLHLLE